jgi:hypothetical protein
MIESILHDYIMIQMSHHDMNDEMHGEKVFEIVTK